MLKPFEDFHGNIDPNNVDGKADSEPGRLFEFKQMKESIRVISAEGIHKLVGFYPGRSFYK